MHNHAFKHAAGTTDEAKKYLLSDGVYFAEVGRKTIFLDLHADKYQAIDRSRFRALSSLYAGSTSEPAEAPTNAQQKLLDTLVTRGLLTTNQRDGRLVQQIQHQAARRHLLPDANAASWLRRTALLARLFYVAARSDGLLAKRPLRACIARVRAAKSTCSATPELPSWLPYFLHARYYYPADRICLRDSFLLMNVLLAHGVAADWVFGVQADPFAAHCWVQIGDLVINDDVERVARFTPILVV
ncbi:lasso peptide biosynthesis B2 protein [Roseiterribacter gracilis]|uniref:Microcin J25-processing protein McjB C-terminal domain-containing protein n=1 Tax=Roseiterribacter gracilis TaxID=2812848 RepID=A0A8S8X5R8_9PROT|nr:hypothetical protein TMPK1_02850 [Rhodospirillales bacterium TMPK1]